MADTDEDYAIIIGIDQYESFNALKGAAADAQAFERWIRDEAKLPDANIEVLADHDESRPMSAIQNPFVQLALKSGDGSKRVGRRLYIFLAGHGAGTEIDRSGLFASDHRKLTPNLLAATGIANMFVQMALFDEVLLFMDCCRSFDGKIEGQNPFNSALFNQDAREVKQCYGYAAKLDQKAREQEFEDGHRGIFTKALVDGLEGRAIDPASHRVTVQSLAKYVKKKMEEFGAKRQNAEFEPDDDILLLEDTGTPMTLVTVRLSAPENSFVVYHGQDIETPLEVIRDKIDDSTWQLSLPSNKKYLFSVLDEQGDSDLSKMKTVRDDPVEIEL